jgi:hypothetical protein
VRPACDPQAALTPRFPALRAAVMDALFGDGGSSDSDDGSFGGTE